MVETLAARRSRRGPDAAGVRRADVLRAALAGTSRPRPTAPRSSRPTAAASVVEGDPRLLKVTTPDDLELVEALSADAADRRLPHAPPRRPRSDRAFRRRGRALRRDGRRARRRRDRLHRARLLLPRRPRALWTLPYQPSGASTTSTSTSSRPRGEEPRPAGEARARGRLRRRAQSELAALLEPYPWDFRLGSVHWLDGSRSTWTPRRLGRMPLDEVWRRYFDALCELAASGHVDVLAHPDLAKIFGRRRRRPAAELHPRAALVTAPRRGGRDLDRRPAQAGRRALSRLELLGSCARRDHARLRRPRARTSSAATSTQALELARAAGYETVTVFEGRQTAPGAAR